MECVWRLNHFHIKTDEMCTAQLSWIFQDLLSNVDKIKLLYKTNAFCVFFYFLLSTVYVPSMQ